MHFNFDNKKRQNLAAMFFSVVKKKTIFNFFTRSTLSHIRRAIILKTNERQKEVVD